MKCDELREVMPFVSMDTIREIERAETADTRESDVDETTEAEVKRVYGQGLSQNAFHLIKVQCAKDLARQLKSDGGVVDLDSAIGFLATRRYAIAEVMMPGYWKLTGRSFGGAIITRLKGRYASYRQSFEELETEKNHDGQYVKRMILEGQKFELVYFTPKRNSVRQCSRYTVSPGYMAAVEKLISSLMNKPYVTRDMAVDYFAHIHFYLSHIALAVRGSAWITEVLIMSIAHHLGFELEFKKMSFPDLDAMSTLTSNEFARTYEEKHLKKPLRLSWKARRKNKHDVTKASRLYALNTPYVPMREAEVDVASFNIHRKYLPSYRMHPKMFFYHHPKNIPNDLLELDLSDLSHLVNASVNLPVFNLTHVYQLIVTYYYGGDVQRKAYLSAVLSAKLLSMEINTFERLLESLEEIKVVDGMDNAFVMLLVGIPEVSELITKASLPQFQLFLFETLHIPIELILYVVMHGAGGALCGKVGVESKASLIQIVGTTYGLADNIEDIHPLSISDEEFDEAYRLLGDIVGLCDIRITSETELSSLTPAWLVAVFSSTDIVYETLHHGCASIDTIVNYLMKNSSGKLTGRGYVDYVDHSRKYMNSFIGGIRAEERAGMEYLFSDEIFDEGSKSVEDDDSDSISGSSSMLSAFDHDYSDDSDWSYGC
ncbi:MAG: hypothetical protein P1U63_05030 [Coxiellaceae bacterium]|nr:hypothetical protein [Coxiellaceae bacterium]